MGAGAMKPEHFQKMKEEYETLKTKKLSEKEVYEIMKAKYDELCAEVQKSNEESTKPKIIKPEEIEQPEVRKKSKTIEEYNW